MKLNSHDCCFNSIHFDIGVSKISNFNQRKLNPLCLLRPSHTPTVIAKKNQLSSLHTKFFFKTATIFPTVLYMGNSFHNKICEEIFVVSAAVCERL